jgi:hypothetical protein
MTVTPLARLVPPPISTSGPMTQQGPMETPSPMRAPLSTIAVG